MRVVNAIVELVPFTELRSIHGLPNDYADGLKDALREAAMSGATVWCGADAVSEEDFATLKVEA